MLSPEAKAPGLDIPAISVIVPHLNQPEPLTRLLASLRDQDLDPGQVEIIVVDNGSREKPDALAAAFPGVRLVEEPTPGPGPARNRGVAAAQAPILAFIDADCVADPRWLTTILTRFAAEPDLAIIGGDVRVLVQSQSNPTPAEAYDLLYAFPQKRYIERMNFSGAGNLATRRTVFDAVGPFAGIGIAEDTDWGQRATRLGYRTVYVPEMVVHHPARRSLTELYIKWDRNISHHYATRRQGPAGRLLWTAKALGVAAIPVLELPRVLVSDRLQGGRSRWRAFHTLARLNLYRTRRMIAAMVRPSVQTASTQWNRE